MKFNRKKPRNNPEVSTASLPDIVFMLLFFFMVATVMRKSDASPNVVIPKVVDIEKVKVEKELRIYLSSENDEINIHGILTHFSNINETIHAITSRLTIEEKENVEVLIFADETIAMQKLYDLKLALRKNDLRKVNYIADYLVEVASR